MSYFIHQNGDVLPSLLVDGFVAGVWRPVEGGIEATAFHALSKAVWRDLASEAHDLVAFLAARDPQVYRRYGHWWAAQPSAEVRILSAYRRDIPRSDNSIEPSGIGGTLDS